MLRILPFVAALALVVITCRDAPRRSPSDDPADYRVDPALRYGLEISSPRWVVPAENLPDGVEVMAANNNVDIFHFGGRLFMAWRTAPTHFAGRRVKMNIVSSVDDGESWELEHRIDLGADLREPRFLAAGSRLMLFYLQGGTSPLSFEPKRIWRIERSPAGDWSERAAVGEPGDVPWTIKWRGDRGYMTGYRGNHYDLDSPGELDVFFRTTTDGVRWRPVDPARPVVYHGGVSEAAFELDARGDLWAVTRNEDGDASGFGHHICHAPARDLAAWDCRPGPERYDSPWMFRHGDEIYVAARRDVGGVIDRGDTASSFGVRKKRYLLAYSFRPKRTAIYRLDRRRSRLVLVTDLPSAGDTAFPSVRRLGHHSFLLANYTSPLDQPDLAWYRGQVSPAGTRIYFVWLTFGPVP